jgi:serine/threonine-protein kinase RsbW
MPGNGDAPSDVRWTKTYDGLPATVREARHDVRAILGPCPPVVADDVQSVVSELAANAVRHSRSGTDGGTYTVRVSHQVTEKVPYIWVEVEDQGSPAWDGILRPEPTHGLTVIQQLSTWMGSDDEPDGVARFTRVLSIALMARRYMEPTAYPSFPLTLTGSGNDNRSCFDPAGKPQEGVTTCSLPAAHAALPNSRTRS